MAEIDYDAAMRLPDGKTCGDCRHTYRCVALFGHKPTDTSCDFYPSRYAARRDRPYPEPIYRLLCDLDVFLHDLHGGEHHARADELHARLHDVMHAAAT